MIAGMLTVIFKKQTYDIEKVHNNDLAEDEEYIPQPEDSHCE